MTWFFQGHTLFAPGRPRIKWFWYLKSTHSKLSEYVFVISVALIEAEILPSESCDFEPMSCLDPFTNWANFWCVCCASVGLWEPWISSWSDNSFYDFQKKIYKNLVITFFDNFYLSGYRSYPHKTPFCTGEVPRESWEKISCNSSQWFCWNRSALIFF